MSEYTVVMSLYLKDERRHTAPFVVKVTATDLYRAKQEALELVKEDKGLGYYGDVEVVAVFESADGWHNRSYDFTA